MKFFFAFAALVAIAFAGPLNKPLTSEAAELEAIIAAIQSPSTDPATAALLEQQLHEILGTTNPIVGPAIVLPELVPVGPVIEPIKPEPISVGPAFIDFPLPEGALAPEAPQPVGPVVAGAAAPLVQLIININQAASGGAVAPAPVVTPALVPEPITVDPVQVVEVAPVAPVVNPVPIYDPVIVAEPVAPVVVDPVIIGTPTLPIVLPEPVIIGTPILPEPVVLPEILN